MSGLHESAAPGTQADLPRNTILLGDARTRLRELSDASVDCVITSPPYFALRDYGEPDQLGLETCVDDWVHDLLKVCAEVKRVLKPTGGFWLNVGDSYSHHRREGAPKKSLLLGPSRLALALVADGWLLRNHIVWAKTNPMPSNVTDRLSNTHESIYFFTRERRYWFDLNAIREPHQNGRVHGRMGPASKRGERTGGGSGNAGGQSRSNRAEAGQIYPPPGVLPRRSDRTYDLNDGLGKLKAAGLVGHPLGKNPGDVWTMGTASFHGEHFATFPARLVERPLLSTCPERTCARCGRPWRRAGQFVHGRRLAVGALRADCGCFSTQAEGDAGEGKTWQPGVVLDPFCGTGTVALVAEQYQRDWVGIELSPAYAEMARKRLEAWREERRRAMS
jgi:DNA modification methylase